MAFIEQRDKLVRLDWLALVLMGGWPSKWRLKTVCFLFTGKLPLSSFDLWHTFRQNRFPTLAKGLKIALEFRVWCH